MLKGTKRFKPYTDGIPTLKTNTGGGVYIIREGNQVVYVGKSNADIKKTLYRHFQRWTDRRSIDAKKYQIYERVTYHGQDLNNYTVQVYYCNDTNKIDLLETTLIFKLKPRDNKQKLQMYTLDQRNTMVTQIENADTWNPISDENPF